MGIIIPDETTLKKRKVKVEIECVTCKENTLTGFFENSDQSTKLTFRTGHKVYPMANAKSRPTTNEGMETRNLYHMVGPVGLYKVKCSIDGEDDDHIGQTDSHER